MNTVTMDEADLIRAVAKSGLHAELVYPSRVFLPIEYVDATGRAACRVCAEKIAKGDRCIAFGFDVFGKQQWSSLQRAYIHIDCTKEET